MTDHSQVPGKSDGGPRGETDSQQIALLRGWHLLQAWASHSSLARSDGEDEPPPPSGSGEVFGAPKDGKNRAKGNFSGVLRYHTKTQRSGTESDALLARKSTVHQALPSYRGHVLMDNRHALVVDCLVT